MDWNQILPGLVAFGLALLVASLVEYWVHRLMHHRWLLGQKHAEHHRDGYGQGWLGELGDYLKGTLALGWLGFLVSVPAGIGFALGGVAYSAWAAYAHQLQHEQPDLVFWLRRPVHYLHHTHHMWRHNFGIALDVWDRVFGTYQLVDWQRSRPLREYSLRQYFQINWGCEPTEDAIDEARKHREARVEIPDSREINAESPEPNVTS